MNNPLDIGARGRWHAAAVPALLLLALLLGGCAQPAPARASATVTTATALPPVGTPPGTPKQIATRTIATKAAATSTPPSTATAVAAPATLAYEGDPCGLLLPILAPAAPLLDAPQVDQAAAAELLAIAPQEARPALEYLLANPHSAGLAAYRLGEQDNGAYLNADTPLPLASVVKIITLVAYAEAVADGRLDANSTVPLADVEAFYLPTVDLNAHNTAVAELRDEGRVFGEPPAVLLDAVAEMMMTHSSNAATDYLHLLLGQETIEQTALDLGLGTQTAPCPFLGQFLAMSNHTRDGVPDEAAVRDYVEDPRRYGAEVMALTEAFSSDPDFRASAIEWRRETRRPNGRVQRLFTESLNARGSAADYAALMARLAQNGLGSAESSFIARRLLEWPLRFPVNLEVFSNVGYKGGSLPGVLTSAYYAYPLSDGVPVVAALFFHDLPGDTYRAWRFNQAHDELARWLLYEPRAIPLLRAALTPS